MTKLSYMMQGRQERELVLKEILDNHPPWALPFYVIDTGEFRQCLYFCQNLQAVSYILSLLGSGEDRIPDKVSVQPYNVKIAYVDESHLSDLFETFIVADEQHSNWSIIFEYSNRGPEYDILSP